MAKLTRKIKRLTPKCKNTAKRSLALFFCILVLLPMIPMVPFSAGADESSAISLSLDDGDPSQAYMVGKPAAFKVTLDVSGLDTTDVYENPVMTLSFDTSAIPGGTKPTVSVSDPPGVLMAAPTVTNATAQTVTWTLVNIPGGTELILPCNITMPAQTTPMDFPLKLILTLTSDNKEPEQVEIEIIWEHKVKTPGKGVAQGDYQETLPVVDGVNGYKVYAGAGDG
ncbi:MAG: hypothetical protein FWG21_06350, partial [Oscillospiraceae bacterium]|nr:hypothetical protein [Oscillospiraceae bacterium]